jgi:hypothetical protein
MDLVLVCFFLETELLYSKSRGLVSGQILQEGINVGVRLGGVLTNLGLGPKGKSCEGLHKLLFGNTPLVVLLVAITDKLFVALI